MYVLAVLLSVVVLAAVARRAGATWGRSMAVATCLVSLDVTRFLFASPVPLALGFGAARADAIAPVVAALYFMHLGVPFVAAWCLGSNSTVSLWPLGTVCAVGGALSAVLGVRPPWMLTDWRALESVEVFAWVASLDACPRAAFPSMHVALPLMLGYTFSPGGLRRAWLAYAALAAWVVVVAGEHWMTDVAGAVALVWVVRSLYERDGAGVFGTAGLGQNVHDECDGARLAEGEQRPSHLLDL